MNNPGEGEWSRRDFLKFAFAAVGTVVGAPILLPLLEPQGENGAEIKKTETSNGVFFMIPERHDQRVCYAQELANIGIVPDVHFVEIITLESAKDFQSNSVPSDVLFWQSASEGENNSYGSFIDEASLIYFAKNAVDVAYEGIMLPSKLDESFVNSAKTVGRDIIGAVANGMEGVSEGSGSGPIEGVLWGMQSDLSKSNPEDVRISFRNLFMARKLQTLAKYYYEKNNQKPNISLEVGYAHKNGLTELLTEGEERTLSVLDGFDVETLRAVVDLNGGIDAICSVLVIPTGEVLIDKKQSKNLILDVELKESLEKKLGLKV